ncbi:uncharacterized protein YceH (UPF0502 family) [Bacillus altitudinis]|uniref:hypothetical protein n=1 Tax=Bacillus altitudinis TaxID=293387 RepID=UPI000401EEDD|nr:hypothetical protein [Bacillus altitudinis]MDR4198893.1 hypothetical protein [Bacillus altitudinis]
MKIKGAIIMENIALPKETLTYSKIKLNKNILNQSNDGIVYNELTNLFNELQALINYTAGYLIKQLNSKPSNKDDEYFKGLFHEVDSTNKKLKKKGAILKNEIMDYIKYNNVDIHYLDDVLKYEQKITKRFLNKELNYNQLELICSYISELLANLKMNLKIKKVNNKQEKKTLLTQGEKKTFSIKTPYVLNQKLYKEKKPA